MQYLVAKQLKKIYFGMLLPSIAILLLIYTLEIVNVISLETLHNNMPIKIIAPIIFILSVCFAFAFPILYRALFVNRLKGKKSISPESLLHFEKNFLYLVMITPYLADLAYLFQLPKLHFAGTFLFTFYSIYYYYPSKKRIHFEQKLFRVKFTENEQNIPAD